MTVKGGGFPSTNSVHLYVPHSETKVAAERPPNTRTCAHASQPETRERNDTAPDSRANPITTEKRDDERAAQTAHLSSSTHYNFGRNLT